jgi:hypothetical protein
MNFLCVMIGMSIGWVILYTFFKSLHRVPFLQIYCRTFSAIISMGSSLGVLKYYSETISSPFDFVFLLPVAVFISLCSFFNDKSAIHSGILLQFSKLVINSVTLFASILSVYSMMYPNRFLETRVELLGDVRTIFNVPFVSQVYLFEDQHIMLDEHKLAFRIKGNGDPYLELDDNKNMGIENTIALDSHNGSKFYVELIPSSFKPRHLLKKDTEVYARIQVNIKKLAASTDSKKIQKAIAESDKSK